MDWCGVMANMLRPKKHATTRPARGHCNSNAAADAEAVARGSSTPTGRVASTQVLNRQLAHAKASCGSCFALVCGIQCIHTVFAAKKNSAAAGAPPTATVWLPEAAQPHTPQPLTPLASDTQKTYKPGEPPSKLMAWRLNHPTSQACVRAWHTRPAAHSRSSTAADSGCSVGAAGHGALQWRGGNCCPLLLQHAPRQKCRQHNIVQSGHINQRTRPHDKQERMQPPAPHLTPPWPPHQQQCVVLCLHSHKALGAAAAACTC